MAWLLKKPLVINKSSIVLLIFVVLNENKNKAMKKILDSTFESTGSYLKNAPDIIHRLSVHKNKTRMKEAMELCRDYLNNLTDPPIVKNMRC